MKILNLTQGTPEWHAARAAHFTASEAPAMMGASKQMKRNELLFAKKTGLDKEVHWWVQKYLFDKGHEIEALARPLVEALIGDELFPATGVSGKLLASFDGMTMDGATLFEHKLWNLELAIQVQVGELEPHYYWQLEQQLLVSGAERVIFVCSDGTADNFVHLEYRPVPGRAQQLLAGWDQFASDLASYQPEAPTAEVVAAPVMSLPAIVYKLDGLALTSNLDAYKVAAERLVEESKRPLETDQDFADRDALNKAFKDAEEKIAVIRGQVVGEIQDVDTFCRELGHIGELIRQARLNGEKQVKARKDTIRLEIQQEAEGAFQAFVGELNARLGKVKLPSLRPDVAGAMKGKKTLASLRDAADTAVAKAKIEANTLAKHYERNLATLDTLAGAHAFLFADVQELVAKAPDDLVRLIQARITEHEAKEAARIEAEVQRKLAIEREAEAAAARKAEADRLRAEAIEREARLQADARQRLAEQGQIPVPGHPQASAPLAVAKVAGTDAPRPSDAIIIEVLVKHFRKPYAEVIAWLRDMDLDAAEAA